MKSSMLNQFLDASCSYYWSYRRRCKMQDTLHITKGLKRWRWWNLPMLCASSPSESHRDLNFCLGWTILCIWLPSFTCFTYTGLQFTLTLGRVFEEHLKSSVVNNRWISGILHALEIKLMAATMIVNSMCNFYRQTYLATFQSRRSRHR